MSQNPLKLKKMVVLVGMMGSGKTAVGRAMAEKLAVDFLDSDQEIVEASTMSIAEIFERDGETFFRNRETEVIRRLLESRVGILSTGGGAFMSAENRRMISDIGVSVWLDADLEILWNRVRHKDTRPLLRTPNPKQTLRDIFEQRTPVYALADLTVKADPDYAIGDMADAVIAALKTRPDVLEVS